MSTPRSLTLPGGVEPTRLTTSRGVEHAMLRTRPGPATAGVEPPVRGRVLLIPGWTGSKEDFAPLLPLLATAGLDTVAFDQRGQYETSADPDDDFSLDGLAADALALAAAAFGDEQPFHLLGHSFGGLVAQRVALQAVPRLASLSLLCTGPGALGDAPQRPLLSVVQALRSGADLDALFERKEAGNRAPAPIMAFLRRRFVANSRESLAAITQHLVDAPDVVDEVAATGTRCWVGRGVGDDAWPWEAQDEMAERLGTHVVVIADADHSPAVENPTALAEAWLPFLLA